MDIKKSIETIENAKKALWQERCAWDEEINKRFLLSIPDFLRAEAEAYIKHEKNGTEVVDDEEEWERDWENGNCHMTEERLDSMANATVRYMLIDFYKDQSNND
jgi:hypothetical protein